MTRILLKNNYFPTSKIDLKPRVLAGYIWICSFLINCLGINRPTLKGFFSKEEIKQAVWDCGLDKSPGPDGFTFGFYRRFWNLIECDVEEAVIHFYKNGFCHKGGNSSFIALIPKKQGANMVNDFRPINLIGSLYKIITKLLANRLAFVINELVNDC